MNPQILGAIKHPELDGDNTLHVVGVVSNPVPYHSRYRIFREWQEHMLGTKNVKLHVVELAFGDRKFEVTGEGEDKRVNYLQLHNVDGVLWHKENLINLGVRHLLPPNWRYMAWVDTDMWFRNPDWAQETMHMLQHYPAVQPWSELVSLGPYGNVMAIHKCFASIVSKNTKPEGHGPELYGRPGGAWAYTREFWENTGGLIDFSIIGSGDYHCAWGMVGHVDHTLGRNLNETYKRLCRDWQQRAYQVTNGYLGHVPGVMEHKFHGPASKRFYVERWNILEEYDFDPMADLRKDADGLIYLAGKPDLQEALRRYLVGRDEDSVDEEAREEGESERKEEGGSEGAGEVGRLRMSEKKGKDSGEKISEEKSLKKPKGNKSRSLSLFLTVPDCSDYRCAALMKKTLAEVGPHVDEIVTVLGNSENRGEGHGIALVRGEIEKYKKNIAIIEVNPKTNAGALFKNAGWRTCSQRWILALELGDSCENAASFAGLCQALEEENIEQAQLRYFHDSKTSEFRGLLVRNLPDICWSDAPWDTLTGAGKVARIYGENGNYDIRKASDIFDSSTYYDLMLEFFKKPRMWTGIRLLSAMSRPAAANKYEKEKIEYAESVLALDSFGSSSDNEAKAWAYSMVGELYEKAKRLEEAQDSYVKSLNLQQNPRTYWLLARVLFDRKDWQECVYCYEKGLKIKDVKLLLNNGHGLEGPTKILFASSLFELGRKKEALRTVAELIAEFPDNKTLESLRLQMVEEVAS